MSSLTPYHRGVYSDTYSVGSQAISKDYILTFTHTATGHSVSFPSTIQDFSDSHTAEISDQIFAGRMDPLIQQKSTGRDITFSFKVLNASVEEARYNEQSVNMLIQMMYPKLRDNGDVEAGSFIKISGLNILKNNRKDKSTTCLIGKISYSLDVDAGFITPTTEELHPISLIISISANAIIPKSKGNSSDPYPSDYPSYT